MNRGQVVHENILRRVAASDMLLSFAASRRVRYARNLADLVHVGQPIQRMSR
jgi:hypothetical protein